MRFAFTNTVWSQSSKSAAIYSLQIQDAGNLSCAFATFWKDVWLRRIIPQIQGTRLYLVGTHSLCPAIFSASSGCAAPPQLHIAPFCPQQSCCGLFCVFRASLPFFTSVSLKFPHFKFTEVFCIATRRPAERGFVSCASQRTSYRMIGQLEKFRERL